jgi:hypothetical protein
VAVERRIGIGHNMGPPLDVSFTGWVWRKAHAEAWKTPPREIAMLRIRRAERLGLSYRDYTAVLMDRGVHMDAIVFAPGALDPAQPPSEVQDRIGGLGDCKLLLCTGRNGAVHPMLRERCDAIVAVLPKPEALAKAIRAFLRKQKLTPRAAFMVGTQLWHERVADESGLSLFKPAWDYFRAKATR